MLFIPEVNPASFVFFFERGGSGASWSIRDYSVPNRVCTLRPVDRPWMADDIFLKARRALDAPAHDTNDLAFWHNYTADVNGQYKLASSLSRPIGGEAASAPSNRPPRAVFPMLDLDQFSPLLPKADDDRVLSSPNSEDWLTRNALHLLQLEHPHDWLESMLAAAARKKGIPDSVLVPTPNRNLMSVSPRAGGAMRSLYMKEKNPPKTHGRSVSSFPNT